MLAVPATPVDYESSFSEDSEAEAPLDETAITQTGGSEEEPLLDVTAATEQSTNCDETLTGGATPQAKRGARSKVSRSLNEHLAMSVTKKKERERANLAKQKKSQERHDMLVRVSGNESMVRRLSVQKQQINELKQEKAKLMEKTKNVQRLQRQMHAAKRARIQSHKSLQVKRQQIDELKTIEPVVAEKDAQLKVLQEKMRSSEDEFACMQKSKGRAIGLMKEIVQRGSLMTNQLQQALESSNEKRTAQVKLTKRSESARKQQQIRIKSMQKSLEAQRGQIKELEVLKPTPERKDEELALELSVLKQQARMQSMQKELRAQRQTIQQFAFLEPELNTKTRDLEILEEDMREANARVAELKSRLDGQTRALQEMEVVQEEEKASLEAAHKRALEQVVKAKNAAEETTKLLEAAHKEASNVMAVEHRKALEGVKEAARQEVEQAKEETAQAKEDAHDEATATAEAARQEVIRAKEETRQVKEDARKHETLAKEAAREDVALAKEETAQVKEDARKEAAAAAESARQELVQVKEEMKQVKGNAQKQVAAARKELLRVKGALAGQRKEAVDEACYSQDEGSDEDTQQTPSAGQSGKALEQAMKAKNAAEETTKLLEAAHKEAINVMAVEHRKALEGVKEAARQEVEQANQGAAHKVEIQKVKHQTMQKQLAQLQGKQEEYEHGMQSKEAEVKRLRAKNSQQEVAQREKLTAMVTTHEKAIRGMSADHAIVLKQKKELIATLRKVEQEMEVAFVRECEKSIELDEQLNLKAKEHVALVARTKTAEKDFQHQLKQKEGLEQDAVCRAQALEEKSRADTASLDSIRQQCKQQIAENNSLRSKLMSEKSMAITNQRILGQQASMATIELQAEMEQLQAQSASTEVRLKTTLSSQKKQRLENEDVRRENKRLVHECKASNELKDGAEATLQDKAREVSQLRKHLSSTKAQLAQKEHKLAILQQQLDLRQDEIETVQKSAARDRVILKKKVVVAHQHAMKVRDDAHKREMVATEAAHREALVKEKKAKRATEESARKQAEAARQEVEQAEQAKEEVRKQAEEAAQVARLEVMQLKQEIVQVNEEKRRHAEEAQQQVERAKEEMIQAKEEARMQAEKAEEVARKGVARQEVARQEIAQAKDALEAAKGQALEAAKEEAREAAREEAKEEAATVSSAELQRQIGQMRADLEKVSTEAVAGKTSAEGEAEDDYADESYAAYAEDEDAAAGAEGGAEGGKAVLSAANAPELSLDTAHSSTLPDSSGGGYPSSPLPGQVQADGGGSVQSTQGGTGRSGPPPSYAETEQKQQQEEEQKPDDASNAGIEQRANEEDQQLSQVSSAVVIQSKVRQLQAWRRFQQQLAMEAAFRRCAGGGR
jgi:hypothetical protein